MKKRIAIWSVLLAMVLTLLAPAAFAEEEPAWSAAYRSFIIDHGFTDCEQSFGYDDQDDTRNYQFVRFGLHDLGSDGVPELIAYNGINAHQGREQYIYAFEEGKVRYLDYFTHYDGDAVYAPGSPYGGLFERWSSKMYGGVCYVTYEDGQFDSTSVYEYQYIDSGDAEDFEPHYEYEQKTDDDALNQLAHNLYNAFDDAGYDEQIFKSVSPYAIPAPTLSEIEAMGWDAFVEEYETRNEALNSGLKYQIKRDDQSYTLSGTAQGDLDVSFYSDCVEILPAETDEIKAINSALKKEAEDFMTENRLPDDVDLSRPDLLTDVHLGNYSVYLNQDLISVCNIEVEAFPGDDVYFYHCHNYDIQSGALITLPAYLGLSAEETKTLVHDAAAPSVEISCEPFFAATNAEDYQYYLDMAGNVHAIFMVDDVAYPAREVILDYTPEPQIISQPEEPVESGDDAVALSVHCYGPDLTYEWEYSDDGEQWVPADCAQPVITIPNEEAVEGRFYRCAVLNSAGKTYSEPVKLSGKVVKASSTKTTASATVTTEADEDRPFPVLLAAATAALFLLLIVLLLILHRRNKYNRLLQNTGPVVEDDETIVEQIPRRAKFCNRCGAPRAGDEPFCTRCGSPFRKP